MRLFSLACLAFVLPAVALAADIPKGGSLLLSKNSAGSIADAPSAHATISANGKLITAATLASNLGPGTFNGFTQVFGYKRGGQLKGLASQTTLGGGANLDCRSSRSSRSGRYVAFESKSSMLVSNVVGGDFQVFRRDTKTGTVELASVTSTGTQVEGQAYVLDISDNGRYVLFEAYSKDVVSGVATPGHRAYVRDLEADTTTLVSQNDAEVPLSNATYNAHLSANGRYAFFSAATAELDGTGKTGVYMRDILLGTTTTLSKNFLGNVANDHTLLLGVSANSRFVVMQSKATNLTGLLEGGLIILDRATGVIDSVDVSEINMPVTGVGNEALISNDGKRLWAQVAYDGGFFFGKKVDLIEFDLAKDKRWNRISIGGQDLMSVVMSYGGSATAEWVAVTTDEKITDSTGFVDTNTQVDLYLLRSH